METLDAPLTPFDFIGAVSHTKKDLIAESDNPAEIERQYDPYIVNRGLALFPDTVLYANEMNIHHQIFKGAQFYYYLGSIRSRKRWSKWPKNDKNKNLDAIQKAYNCNRTVARQYMTVLSSEQIEAIHHSQDKGGQQK